MTIVRCPRCGDEVTLPPRAGGGALVRCPLCLEEYLLAEVVAQVPPALVVISGPAGQAELVTAGDVEQELEAEYRLEEAGLRSSAGATTAAVRPVLRPMHRPARKEKSVAAEIVKVVLGGVVGLALGLLVLWWFVDRDDFRLGPEVAKYAPWIVPTKFRSSSNSGVEPLTSGRESTDRMKKNEVTTNGSSEMDRRSEAGQDADQPPEVTALRPTVPADGALIPPREPRDDSDTPRRFVPARPMPDLTDLLPDDAP